MTTQTPKDPIARISSDPMKLVINIPNIARKGVVHLCIGGLTFPITREDLVTLLFGEEVQESVEVASETPPYLPPGKYKITPDNTERSSLDDEIDEELSKLRKSGRVGRPDSKRSFQVSSGVNARLAERRAQGLCYANCNRKTEPGKSYCKVHLKRMGQGMLKARSMRGKA